MSFFSTLVRILLFFDSSYQDKQWNNMAWKFDPNLAIIKSNFIFKKIVKKLGLIAIYYSRGVDIVLQRSLKIRTWKKIEVRGVIRDTYKL